MVILCIKSSFLTMGMCVSLTFETTSVQLLANSIAYLFEYVQYVSTWIMNVCTWASRDVSSNEKDRLLEIGNGELITNRNTPLSKWVFQKTRMDEAYLSANGIH